MKSGLVFLLLGQAVGGVKGAVQGSTTLYLSYGTITDYDTVTRKIAELTAPYEYVNWLGMGLEVVTLVLAVAAVVSLHSVKNRSTHVATAAGAVITFVIGTIAKWYYLSATDAALASLPTMVPADALETFLRVQEQFRAAYGFWGTPAPGALNTIFSFAGLALFVGAWITSRQLTVWQPTPTPAVPSVPPVPEPAAPPKQAPTTVVPAMPTKFCRFCGAKIPHVSKYCEECGAKLT